MHTVLHSVLLSSQAFACMMQMVITLHSEQTSKTGDALSLLQVADMSKLPLPSLSRSSTPSSHSLASPLYAPRMYDCDLPECEVELDMRVNDEGKVKLHFILYENDAEDDAKVDAERETLDNYAYAEDDFDAEDEDAVMEAMYFNESRLSDSEMEMEMEAREDNDDKDGPTRLLPASQDNPFSELADICQRLQHKLMETERGLVSRRDLRQSRRGDPTSVSSYLSMSNSMTAQEETALSTVSLPSMMQALPRAPPSSPNTSHIDHVTDGGLNTGHLRRHAIAAALQHSEFGVLSASQLILPAAKLETTLVPADIELSSSGLALSELRNFNNASMSVDSSCGGSNSGSGSIHIEMESRDLRTAPPDDVDVIVEASEKGAEIHEPAAICEKAMDAQELEGKEVEMVVCKTISGVAEATGHYCSESISERNDNAATTVTSIGSGGYHRGGRDSAEKSDTTVFFDFRFDCDKHGYVTLNIHPITDVESSQTADDHMCGGKMYANESKNEHEKAVVAIEAAVNGREIDDEEGVDEEGSTSIEEGGDTFITPNTTMLSTHAIEQDTFLIHGNTGPEAEKKNGKSPHQTPPETSVKNAHRTEEKDEDGQKEEEEKKSSKSSSLLSHMSSLIQVTRERDAGMLSILRLRREKEEQTAKISDLETALIQMQRKCERLLAESAAAVSVAPISTLTSCADAGGLKLSDDTTPVNDILANTLRDNKSETGKENISATSQSSAANSAPANQQLNRKRTAINIQSNGVALSEYSVPSKQSSSSILSQPMTLSQLHSQINSIKAQRRESQQRMGSYMYGAPFSPPPSTMSTNTEGEGAAEDSGVSMNETGSNVCANGALDVSPVMLHYDMDESSRYPFDMMMMMSGDEGDINIHMLTPIPKSSSYHIDKDEIDNDDEVNGNDSSGPGKSDEGVVKERIQDLTRGHTKVDGSLLPLSFLPTSPSPTRNIISAAKEIKVNNTDSGSHVEDVACKENDFSKDFSSAPMLIGNQEKQMQQDKDAKGSKGKHSVPTIGAFSQQRREEMLQNFLAEPLMWSPPVSSPNKTLVTSSDGHTNKSKCGDAPGDKADGEGGNISSSTVNSKAASSSSTTPVPFGTGSRLTYDSMAPVIRDEAKTNNQEKAAPSGADRRTIRFNVDTDDSAGNASMKDVSRDPSKNLSSPYSLPCASSMMSNMSLDMSLCLNKMDLQHELTSYGATSLSPLPLGLGQSLLAEKLGDNNGKMFASISRANDKQADSIGVSSSHHQTGLPPVPVFSTNEEAAGNNVVSTNLHTIAEKKEGDEAPIEVSKARDNASGAISIQENTLANGGPGSGHHRRSSSGSHKFLQSMRFASELLARSKNDTSMSSLSSNSLTTNGSVPASFQGVSSTTNVSNMSNVDPLHSNGGSSSGGRSQAERIRSQLLSSKLQLQKSVRLNHAAQTSTESKSVAVDDGNGASEAQHNALSPNGGGVSKQRLLSRQRMKKRIENRRQDFDETGVNEGQDAGEEDVGDVAGSGSPGDQSGRSQRSFHRRKQKQKSFNHHRQQQQLDHNSSGDKSTIESDLQQEGFSRDSHVHSADAHKQNDSEDNSNADIMALMAAAENDQTMDQTFFKLIDGTVNDDDHGSPALLPTQEQSSRPPAQSRPRHSRSQSQPQTGCSRNHTAGTPGHQAHQKFQLDSLDSSSMFRSFDPVSPQPGGMTRGRANIGYKPCVYDDDVDDNDNHQLISPLSPLPQRSHNRHHRRHSYKAPPKATPSPHYNQSARVDSSMHSSMHSAHSSVHLHTGESLYYSHSNDTNGSIMNHSASSNSNSRSLVGSEPELSHGGPPGARFQDRAELVIPEDETATEDEGDKSFCVVG